MVKRTDVSLAQTPEPHYIPGYIGHCPRFIYRCGDTYGSLTHFLLLDPCSSHGQSLTLSNRGCSDYHVERPTLTELDLARKREERIDSVYKHPMVPGYEGFIPRYRERLGNRFTIAAIDGMSEFERNFLRKRCDEKKMKVRGALQSREIPERRIGEMSQQTAEHKFLVEAVHSEAAGFNIQTGSKDLSIPYPKKMPYKTREGKYLFDHDKRRCTTEWAPILPKIACAKAPDEAYKIYFEDRGLIPGYKGHVPGMQNKYGTTFGRMSIDAKGETYCENN